MATIHLADGVCGTVMENSVKIFDFVFPFTMGAFLKFWKEKRLARVETTVNNA
jgi:hypothetical protein